ncbi:hypothetical protein RHCRD62_20333 [Rhodococcus sp. RD6.2]|nr:hypothetical protein RHCRD62_20333 [Rhodococcus sp. RD6.2]
MDTGWLECQHDSTRNHFESGDLWRRRPSRRQSNAQAGIGFLLRVEVEGPALGVEVSAVSRKCM